MDIFTLALLAVGLSMDAFAVSICKGLAMRKITIGKSAVVGLWFGGFQALMPFIGYILGVQFEKYIEVFSSWIAFILLAAIGGNMIKEALSKEEGTENDSVSFREMFVLAVATSIDALAVGVTFACVPVRIAPQLNNMLNTLIACLMIGVTTCIISVCGVKIGNVFGTKYKSKAELAGGIILVMIGLRIIIEHFMQ